jgi:hypothetical protein
MKKFLEDKANLGGLILEGMKTTGGTDIDWVVEHRGGFILMENKTLNNGWISLPQGQIITFENMYQKLNSDGRCHFLVFGFDSEIDFKNQESVIYYFDMKYWMNGKICPNRTITFKAYGVHKREMNQITLHEYRELMEKYWKEFENKFQLSKVLKDIEIQNSKTA